MVSVSEKNHVRGRSEIIRRLVGIWHHGRTTLINIFLGQLFNKQFEQGIIFLHTNCDCLLTTKSRTILQDSQCHELTNDAAPPSNTSPLLLEKQRMKTNHMSSHTTSKLLSFDGYICKNTFLIPMLP